MPQSLQDIEDRLELLKMTLGLFAPEEPEPIAAELVQLGEEILEHWLRANSRSPAAAGDASRLLALQAQSAAVAPEFEPCRAACLELLEQGNLVTTEPEHAATVERLLAAVTAAFHLYSLVTSRMAEAGLREVATR